MTPRRVSRHASPDDMAVHGRRRVVDAGGESPLGHVHELADAEAGIVGDPPLGVQHHRALDGVAGISDVVVAGTATFRGGEAKYADNIRALKGN